MPPKNPEGLDDIIKAAFKVAKIASKGASKGAKKVNPKNSYALGRTVVHGSPTRGLKTISPRKGSAALPDESVVFVWDPKGFGKRGSIASAVEEYTRGTGSAYIGKVPRSSLKSTGKGIGAASKPMKVKKEVIANPQGFSDLYRGLDKGLLRQGVVKKPTVAGAKSKTKKVVKKAETIASKNKKIKKVIAKTKRNDSVV